ncbi:MAG: DUF983 domain-containing protein [Candidatus Puniceispirillaceae bacterium]
MKIVEKSRHRSEKGDKLGAVETDLLADRQFSFSLLWRGIQKRCPKCGIGAVLTGYLKPASSCSHCGEDFSHISADDGPAWLTLLIVGHAIVPLMLVFGRDNAIPAWFSITSLTLITLFGVYFVLPRAKGAFIALIWVTGATGQDMFTNDQESQDHPTDR